MTERTLAGRDAGGSRDAEKARRKDPSTAFSPRREWGGWTVGSEATDRPPAIPDTAHREDPLFLGSHPGQSKAYTGQGCMGRGAGPVFPAAARRRPTGENHRGPVNRGWMDSWGTSPTEHCPALERRGILTRAKMWGSP